MSDTSTDHADRIRELLQWGPITKATNTRLVRMDNEREVLERVDALAAERDALRTYAQRIEREYIFGHADRTFMDNHEARAQIVAERLVDGVTEIMGDLPE